MKSNSRDLLIDIKLDLLGINTALYQVKCKFNEYFHLFPAARMEGVVAQNPNFFKKLGFYVQLIPMALLLQQSSKD